MKLSFWKSSEKINNGMKLIVGLGNPGREYAGSPHNAGFVCVNHFARQYKIRFDKSEGLARTGRGQVEGIDLVVARPQTYMNRSGESVSRLVKKYKVDLQDLLVIYDDMDLPLGKIRVRPDGSSGGHNGIKSIIASLGSQDFPRLRVGIGRPKDAEGFPRTVNGKIINYLLGELSDEEKTAINNVLPAVSEAILCVITEGVTEAMNRFNNNKGRTRERTPEEE
jgi:PTH1 family peptidyl-tRNA hydrolase